MKSRISLALAVAGATMALSTAPAGAIVGGGPASPGEYPSVAEITFGMFSCTGTLIAPNWVLSAGHCGSPTGIAVATPASWPAALIDVRIGSITPGAGESRPVKRVVMQPNYLLNRGYDISLLELSAPSTKTPTKVVGAGERASWNAGVMETIVGFGDTSGGGTPASTLQEGQVPITTDAYCASAYGSSFESVTMVCAGFPEGGVDTCQGDSGGPMFGTAGGVRRVVGATSWGSGCAQAGSPGVYARVGDTTLREWIRTQAPAGVA